MDYQLHLPTFTDAFIVSVITTLLSYAIFHTNARLTGFFIKHDTFRTFAILMLGGFFTWIYFFFYYYKLSLVSPGFRSIHIYSANLCARLAFAAFVIYYIVKKIYQELKRSGKI
jgi:hypothetical protein